MKKWLIGLLFLSSCDFEYNELHTKGIVAGFFETKNSNNSVVSCMSIQDTSGKIFTVKRSKCPDCLMNDSVKLTYEDKSLIQDAGDKYEVDSCVKFYNATWKVEKYEKTLYFYDDSGRLIKKTDTTFVKR